MPIMNKNCYQGQSYFSYLPFFIESYRFKTMSSSVLKEWLASLGEVLASQTTGRYCIMVLQRPRLPSRCVPQFSCLSTATAP
jgi:hypothetical protein